MSDQTAYAVSSGSYSDYSVTAVFTTREAAEAYARDLNSRRHQGYRESDDSFVPYDEYEVEEFPLNPTAPPLVEGAWSVTVRQDGRPTSASWDDEAHPTDPTVQLEQGFPVDRAPWIVRGYGPTIEHARRSAEELRRAILTGAVASQPVSWSSYRRARRQARP